MKQEYVLEIMEKKFSYQMLGWNATTRRSIWYILCKHGVGFSSSGKASFFIKFGQGTWET